MLAAVADAIGTVAALTQLASAAAAGFRKVLNLQPEYGPFWQAFQARALSEKHDMPLEAIRGWRLDPEFICAACCLMHGDRDGLDALRSNWFVPASRRLPRGSRLDPEEAVESLERWAREAAVEASRRHPELSLLAQTLMIEAAVAQHGRSITEQLQSTETRLEAKLDALIVALQAGGLSVSLAATDGPVADMHAPSARGPDEPPPSERTLRLRETLARREQAITDFVHRLREDPDITELVMYPRFGVEQRGVHLRPDIAVRDDRGTVWLLEFRQRTNPPRRAAQRELTEFAEHVGGRWRYLTIRLSRPEDVRSFRETVAMGGRLTP
jgi:hypothetical protein